jgi:putative ABC transport system permease protein
VTGVIPDIPTTASWRIARVVLPIDVARMEFGRFDEISAILVFWADHEQMDETVAQVRAVMNLRMGEQGYFLSIPLELLKKRQSIVSGILVLGVAGAALCILVAAGGIMNVMLANVVQRTHEYGIRLACGADMNDIFLLVMGESLLLSLLSGVLGIGLGAAVAVFAGQGLAALFPDALGLQPVFHLQDFLIPLVVAVVFGLAAGFVPALRAYKLDILTALRSE